MARTDASAAAQPPWAVLGLLALGVASVLLLLASDRVRQRAVIADHALLLAATEVQRDVATAHLWLEEYVSGDRVELAAIYGGLDRAATRVDAMLDAPSTQAGPTGKALEPLTQDVLLGHATNLKFLLERFRQLSGQRQKGRDEGRDVGIGSALDEAYDQVFAELLTEAERLVQGLEARRDRGRRRSRQVLLGIVTTWALLVGLAAASLWTRERRRRQAVADLDTSREQLLQAQKMEAVGRLADGIAHDINNYLAAVRGHCELVAMRFAEEPRIVDKMEAAVGTVLKASALLDRLLAFSRQRAPHTEVVNLNHVVDGLGKMMERLLGDDVRLVTDLAAGLWNVRADPAQLEQVVVNLLLNARDAMPTGGELRLETCNAQRDGREVVVLTVGDSGAGIAPEIRDKIFEPFFTTKAHSGSSGLGLATVYGIVKRHKGRIAVQSEVGRGSLFDVALPRCHEALTPAAVIAADETPRTGHSEHLLLVDDNLSFRTATAALLAGLGYRVTEAASGEQALDILTTADDIRLVLTDVVMPGLSGRELIEGLAAGPRQISVLVMSGYDATVLERHGMPSGEAWLKKPFSAAELARTVRAALGRR